MRTVLLTLFIAALWPGTFARAQESSQGVLVVSGIRYRYSRVNSSLMLVPEAPLATPRSARALLDGEKLARCDEFIARALGLLDLAGPSEARLVRDRVEPRPENRSWVLYAQRHQGYWIYGPGARLEIDSRGRVLFAGVHYETEKLRDFRALGLAALEKRAASVLPHPRLGPAFEKELAIDPLDAAPAKLCAYFIYPVRTRGGIESWQVVLDAETGEVVYSSSTSLRSRRGAERFESCHLPVTVALSRRRRQLARARDGGMVRVR